jgi:uncharacterized protein
MQLVRHFLGCWSAAALALVAGSAWAQAAIWLPGIAAGDVALPLTSLRQSRLNGTLLQQYDFSCGSAAVATLLTYQYGLSVSEEAVFEQMFRLGDAQKIRQEGFSLLDMKRFLKTRGFDADGFQQPLEKLAESRVPAIVLVNERGYHHFVVVKGLRHDRVLLGDPASGTRTMARRDFDAIWQSKLLFVVHNRMNQARFNRDADWHAAPALPLAEALVREGLGTVTMPRHPGDF